MGFSGCDTSCGFRVSSWNSEPISFVVAFMTDVNIRRIMNKNIQ